MATICTSCPNTGRDISTGIETDTDSFAVMPDVITRVHCPYCGEQHNWSKYNAFLRVTGSMRSPKRNGEG
jgi:hypothetical protein